MGLRQVPAVTSGTSIESAEELAIQGGDSVGPFARLGAMRVGTFRASRSRGKEALTPSARRRVLRGSRPLSGPGAPQAAPRAIKAVSWGRRGLLGGQSCVYASRGRSHVARAGRSSEQAGHLVS